MRRVLSSGWVERACRVIRAAMGVAMLTSAAAHGEPIHASTGSSVAPCEGDPRAPLGCASVVTPHVDPRGRLWLAWQGSGQVVVGQVDEPLATPRPIAVLDQPGRLLDAGTDARPQIVVDARDRVLVAWSVFKDRRWNAEVRLARSSDGGRTFSRPGLLSDDPHSQRFPLLLRDGERGLLAAWLDKRPADVRAGSDLTASGARLAFARSSDGGQSWSPTSFAPGASCECCRLAGVAGPDGAAAVLYRAIFEGSERDHALLRLPNGEGPATTQRIARDRWAIEGCPHHGPALARDAEGRTLAAWFTQGQARQGLYLAHAERLGEAFGEPVSVDVAVRQPGRPQLLAEGRSVWLAWKTFDGQSVEVRWRRSDDGGRSWTADQVAACTEGASDHPQLIRWRNETWLSWVTRDRGWRLLPLPAQHTEKRMTP